MARPIIVDGRHVGSAPDDATDEELAALAEELSAGTAAYARGAEAIGEPPIYQRRRIPGTSIDLPFSLEDVAEALPAAAATGAAFLGTRSPVAAAAAGSAAGEAGRQLLRRGMGAAAATGMVQRATGMDPDSPEAAVAGFVGEATLGATRPRVARLLRGAAGGAEHSAERAVVRDILGGARTEREIEEAPKLAKRALAAKLLRSSTTRGRLARAEAALGKATATADVETRAARQAGTLVEAEPVLTAIQGELPASIPGSGVARKATRAERNAVLKVLDDELSAIVNTGGRSATGTAVPADVALGEIKALDAQLDAMYRRGALDPALGKAGVKAGVDAFRVQLRAVLPELADARLEKHELIMITEMLERQLGEQFTARGAVHPAAGVLGAAAIGRPAPAAARAASAIAGMTAPLTIPARYLFAKLAAGGANTAQLWLRAANLFGLNRTTEQEIRYRERNRRAQRALRQQAEGVVP